MIPKQLDEKPLQSWKEIATYLERDVRTAMRWERDDRLPVRRIRDSGRAAVYAYPSEIEAWRANRKPQTEALGHWFGRRRLVQVAAVTGVLLVAAWVIYQSPILNPPSPRAEAAGSAPQAAVRRIWSKADIFGSVSPDGRFLTFAAWETGNVGLYDLTTAKSRLLTSDGSPGRFAYMSVVSADGRFVAYSSCCEAAIDGKKGGYSLRVVEIGDGPSTPRTLFVSDKVPYLDPMDWSPEGDEVLVMLAKLSGDKQLVWISVGDASVRPILTVDSGYPKARVSPDGKSIAYHKAPADDMTKRDLYLMAADGGGAHTMIGDHPGQDQLLGWSPDGSRVLFLSDRRGSFDVWAVAVSEGRVMGEPELIHPALGDVGRSLGLTRDGTLYFGRGVSELDVYLAEYDPRTGAVTAEPRRLTQLYQGHNTTPAWSPDGSRIAYLTKKTRKGVVPTSRTVRIQSLEDGQANEIETELVFHYNFPIHWSPDGSYLMVLAGKAEFGNGLYRIDVETGEVRPMVITEPGRAIRFGALTPNGKTLFYALNPNPFGVAEILKHDLETGESLVFFRSPADPDVGQLSISPDGHTLAFSVGSGRGLEGRIVYVTPLGGSAEPREVLNLGESEGGEARVQGLEWSRDGKFLVYSLSAKQPELWRIAVDGGEPERIGLKGRAHRIHSDGRLIAYVDGELRHEIWALENFLPKVEAED